MQQGTAHSGSKPEPSPGIDAPQARGNRAASIPKIAPSVRIAQWELAHLRQLVADQQALIEAQDQQLRDLQRELSYANDCAEMWRDDALQAIKDNGHTVGLTRDGRIVAVQAGHA